jgi:hypothetical protein
VTWLRNSVKILCSGIALFAVIPQATWAGVSQIVGTNESSGSSVVEPEPEFVTVLLTTPTQEQFTVGAPSGSLVQVTNNQTGEQFAFYVAPAPSGAVGSLIPSPPANRKKPERFSLRLFRIDNSDQGSLMTLVAAVDQLSAGEEFVEPKSGLVFRPLSTAQSKEYWPAKEGGVGLLLCCVDCGFYTICGARVSGCGHMCYNYFGRAAGEACSHSEIHTGFGENEPN